MPGRWGESATTLLAAFLGVFSLAAAVYHWIIHQAPLLPTILGQWLLGLVAALFFASLYYTLGRVETAAERATIGTRVCTAYGLGASVSLAYASHQYFTPIAEVGVATVIFEAVFTASALGVAGSVIGLKSVQHGRALSEVTERRQALLDEQALSTSIFDALPDVLYAFDEQGNFFEWNERFREVTGYSDEEIRSMRPAEFVADEDRADVLDAIERVFEHDETVTVEARFETSDGERIPYEFTGSKITRQDGESLGLVGVGRDLSRLEEQRERFRAVFNNTYQFIGLLDTDGEVLEVNRTALDFGGLDRSDVVGKKLWDTHWFQTGDQARTAARRAVEEARGGSLYREEITVQGARRTEIIDFSVRPMTDADGETALLVPEGRLITNLKERERHLQVLHRFLRHNLRNKMTTIRGSADVLNRRLSDPEYDDLLSNIEAASEELIELSETAHELSRVAIQESEEPRPIALGQALESVRAKLTDRYPSATISLEVGTDAAVRADWRIENVLEQLIENAIEHATHEDPTVDVEAERTGGTVSIRVADEGPGIPPDELAGVTTDEEPTQLTHGTGFGLWLVRSVVDDYDGTIDYEPRPGGGSIVTVELQRADTGRSPAENRGETSNP